MNNKKVGKKIKKRQALDKKRAKIRGEKQ